jgi:hypothetical protein
MGVGEVEDDADGNDGLPSRQDRHQQRQAKFALDELNELVTRQLKKEGLVAPGGSRCVP